MKSLKESYLELLHLTQLFLLREHPLTELKTVDSTLFSLLRTKKTEAPPLQTPPKQPISIAPSLPSPMLKSTVSPPPIVPKIQKPSNHPLEPPQEKKQEKQLPLKDNSSFALENKPASPAYFDHSGWKKLCSTLFPTWLIRETIPDDSLAKKNKNIWLKEQEISPVMILSFNDNEQHMTFLKNVARAISLYYMPAHALSAKKMEQENTWENFLNSPHLKLIIASDSDFYLNPKLVSLHRQDNRHFLKHVPLFFLSDPSLYLKEPQLKSLLWRAICSECGTLANNS